MNQRFRALRELGEQFEQVSAQAGAARGVWGLRRWPRRWRPTVLVALAAVLLAGSAAAAVSLVGRGGAPVHAPGGAAICPVDEPYMADAKRMVFYPPNYPETTIRGDVRNVSCFDSAAAARKARYRLAPSPAGDAPLGQLYTEPAPRAVRALCRRAQSRTSAVVYCPTRLPAPWISPTSNDNCPTAQCVAPLVSLTGSFTIPPAYAGSSATTGELVTWMASTRQQHLYLYLVGCLGNPARLVSRTSFRGHPAAWYRCSLVDGSPSSMLEWRIGNEHYGVGASGSPPTRRRLVTYVAAHMVAQRQPSGRK